MSLTKSLFQLEIYASDKIFFEGKAQAVNLPVIGGPWMILPNHEDMIAVLVPGLVTVRREDGVEISAVVSSGMVEFVNNSGKVFVHSAERPEDIDRVRAEEAKERAQERLSQKRSIQEYHLNEAALSRAMSRLKAASKYK